MFGICPELVLGHHPQLLVCICPPWWGLSRAARSYSSGSMFLAGASCGSLAKLRTDLCRLELDRKSWWQVWPRELGLHYPVLIPSCFQESLSKNTKAAGRLGPLSLDLSSPIHEEGMCKRGSFTVHGGRGSPAPHLPSLALQVCLWAGEMNFSLAISTFRKHPVPSLSVHSGWGS